MSARIGVVGGGFSGLLVAYLLEQALCEPPEITILEAAPRLGGRVKTDWIDEAGCRYDSGAAELYDIRHSPGLKSLVTGLGLASRPMVSTPPMYFQDQLLRSERDVRGALGDAAYAELKEFWELGMSLRTPRQYAAAGHPEDNDHPWLHQSFEDVLRQVSDPAAREFLKVQAHSDVAAEPSETSGLFGFDNLLIDHPDYCSMYTLEGGNETLITALQDATSATSMLRTRVDRISSLGASAWDVGFTREGAFDTATFDYLVATIHPSDLTRICWSDPELERGILRIARHHDHWASYLRVTIALRERFWTEELPGDYFVSDSFGGTTIYDRSDPDADQGQLSWLLAGKAASEMEGWPDDEIVSAVMDSLPPELCAARDGLLASRVDRWSRSQGVSRLPGGRSLLGLRQRHFPIPSLPSFALTGDYLYDSTLCGALDGASFVASQMLPLLEPGAVFSDVNPLRRFAEDLAPDLGFPDRPVESSIFPFPALSAPDGGGLS